MFNEEVKKRIIEEATYLVINSATIRKTAKEFCVPKTRIHVDVTKRLKYIDTKLYKQVRAVLDYNISQRAIRGGMATKEKYKK